MNFYVKDRFLAPKTIAKYLLIMKLVILLTIATILQVHAKVLHAQSVTLNVKNAQLVNVFKEIRKQTNYDFVYNDQVMEKAKTITLNLRNVSLLEALKKSFQDQPFDFVVDDKTIVVVEKSNFVASTEPERLSPIQVPTTQVTIVNSAGKPIANASINYIAKKGVNVNFPASIAGQDGAYLLSRTPAMQDNVESLRITAIGYEPITVPFPKNQLLRIVMQETVEEMSEVVVTGIFSSPIESFTGSSITVTAEELAKFGSRNLISSLRNIDPSFNIIENNTFGSDPNRLPEIQVRGNSSIPNVTELQDQTRNDLNTPLIILDGFETTLRALYDLNENEVESLTLLMDASATSMYVSRGANGVLIIKYLTPPPGKL